MEDDQSLKKEILIKLQFLIMEHIEVSILKIAYESINNNIDIDKTISNLIKDMNNISYEIDSIKVSLKDVISYYLEHNNINNLYDYLYKNAMDLITDYNSYLYNINIVYSDFIESAYFDEAMYDILNDNFCSDISIDLKKYKSKSKDSYLYKLRNNRMRKSILYYLDGINDNLYNLDSIDEYDDLYIEKLYNKEKDKTL